MRFRYGLSFRKKCNGAIEPNRNARYTRRCWWWLGKFRKWGFRYASYLKDYQTPVWPVATTTRCLASIYTCLLHFTTSLYLTSIQFTCFFCFTCFPCFTCVSLVLHLYFTCISILLVSLDSLVFHFCFTCVSLVLHVFHFCFTCALLVFHMYFTIVSLDSLVSFVFHLIYLFHLYLTCVPLVFHFS